MICDGCGKDMETRIVMDIINARRDWVKKHFCGLHCAKEFLDEKCEEIVS
jgi:hypothetical protein